MSKQRELNDAELEALEMNEKLGVTRSKLEDESLRPETMNGKLADALRTKARKMLREKGFDLDEVDPKVIEGWVEDQIKAPSVKREEVRERNLKLIKEFGKGGRFEGRRLDPRALFKGDEFEDIAMEPGGIPEVMSMKSSLPTALKYLEFLQKEGHQTFAGVDYSKAVY